MHYRIPLLVILAAFAFFGQVSTVDSRVAEIPGAKSHFTMPEYKTLAAWESRKAQLRRQILFAAGLLPMPEKTPLNAKIFGRLERKDYSIEKVYLETTPGFYLGGNLYRPLGRKGKFPGVASPHGHWEYGRLENQPLASVPARAINLARQGYVVFSYDMVGYNDTLQTPHRFWEPLQQLWSFNSLGMQLWDSIRAVDFLTSLPDVDPKRIAATGASGGGVQSFMLTAVDDRVGFSVPVSIVSAYMQGGCDCANAPGLRFDTSNLEIAAMMAPRPMLLVSATGDFTKNVPNEEYPAIRRIYQLYGKAENLEQVQIDAPHNYNQESREAMYRFFGKRVLGESDAQKFKENSTKMEKLQDLLVFEGRALPDNALTYEGIFSRWKNVCHRQSEKELDHAIVRERLLLALGAEWPANVLSSNRDGKLALSRAGKGDRVTGAWKDGSGMPALVIGGGSVPGRPALTLDIFDAKRDQTQPHFLSFNRTDDAIRVQDILTALAYMHAKHPGKIELIGNGKAAVACLFAAAAAPIDLKLTANIAGFTGTDDDFLKQFFVPGIERAGGMPAALMLTAGKR